MNESAARRARDRSSLEGRGGRSNLGLPRVTDQHQDQAQTGQNFTDWKRWPRNYGVMKPVTTEENGRGR